MELFDYQRKVLEDVRYAIRGGARSVLIVAPAGSGKTVMGAQIIRGAEEKGHQCLFTAHRRELVNQSADKLAKFGVKHGIIMAGKRPATWYSTQVASIDTIRARCLNPKRKIKQPLPRAQILEVDEAHRSCSPTYTTLIDHYRAQPGSIVIGLTATPIRGDGKGLGRHYDEMVLAPTMQELIDMGRLVPPRYFVPSVQDLTGVPISKGDYVEKHLGKVMGSKEVIGDVIEHYKKLAYGRPAILFAPDVKSSIGHCEGLNRAGIPAAHIDASTSIEERARIITQLASGEILVVCNCMVLTEGFDCPPVSCIILCRPTRNLGLYIQMGCRGDRTYEGKEDFIVIDHSGSFYEHGYLEDDHEWKLTDGNDACESREERQKKLDEKDPITCVECSHVYRGQLICPNCGHEPQKRGKKIESRHADLIEVRKEKRERKNKPKELPPAEWSNDQKQLWYSMLLQIAREKGIKEGAVAHRFKAKFGHWPRNMKKIPTEPTPEVRRFDRYLNIRYAKGKAKANAA